MKSKLTYLFYRLFEASTWAGFGVVFTALADKLQDPRLYIAASFCGLMAVLMKGGEYKPNE